MTRTAFLLLFLVASSEMAVSQYTLENAFPALSFSRPVDLQHAGDGSNRLFVVEQAGRIFVFDNNPTVPSKAQFLDIRGKVNSGGNEEGLLGLAFHPSFKDNGYFYVNYTATSPRRTVISRFTVSTGDPNAAEVSSEHVILEFNQPYSNHNGGQITFGPDGYLYIATGDGGSGGDPQNNSQNRRNLLGKILRIDVDRASDSRNYSIPPDNPWAGNDAGFSEEIWAYGLRNPWRFSFDTVSGRLWTADVGQNRFEEINIIEKGRNYGWRIMEGFACYNPPSGCDQTGLELPIFAYAHDQGKSVTGGFVYRGNARPELDGSYLYADFVSGRLWSLRLDPTGEASNELLLSTGHNISSFGVDESNEIYLCSFDGSILRFRPTQTNLDAMPGPSSFDLSGIHPQPARAGLHERLDVTVELAVASRIRLVLHDTLGRELRSAAQGEYMAGKHVLQFPITSLAPGMYILSLETTNARSSRKLLIMQ
jgi:glucose/arabinose dehydrogenase